MPEWERELNPEDIERRAPTPKEGELKPYMAIIDNAKQTTIRGGVVKLLPEDKQRTVKRRLSVAARQQGFNLTWRKSPVEGRLLFVLTQGDETPPGVTKRGPRKKTQETLSHEPAPSEDSQTGPNSQG